MIQTKAFIRILWAVLCVGLLVVGVSGPRSGQVPVQASGCWQAQITEQRLDLDLAGSVLRVSVEGLAGLPVTIRSLGGFETVGFTGTKPEYGPYVAEFAPMSRGIYFIEPQGLGTVFEIFLDGKNYTRVDFTALPCAPAPSPTVAPPQPTPSIRVTATPRVIPPTKVPAPTSQPAEPSAGWRGRVAQHLTDLDGRYYATIAVRVIGRPAGQEVQIQSGNWSETCKTGTKPEHGPDACEFGSLKAGPYRLWPTGLDTHLDIDVDLKDFVLVEFYYAGPAPQTRWVGSVVENTSSSEPTEHANSAVAVIVAGRPWHQVDIQADGFAASCTTGYKPEYGPDACEFGGLRAATYTITPKDLGVSAQVTVDGWGWAMVRFDEVAAVQPVPTRPPLDRPPAVQPTASPSAPPASQPLPTPTATGALWKGAVVSNTSGEQEGAGVSSVIVVRVLNWPGVPVTITGGGGWRAICVTGTKPEYGPDACEFGGLWPSVYTLRPEGADVAVDVEMDGRGVAFVEFTAP